jgi:hypothetical protein
VQLQSEMTVFEQIEILMAGRNPNAHGPLTEAEVSALRPALKTDEVVDAFVRGRVPGGGAGLWVLTAQRVLVVAAELSAKPRVIELVAVQSVVCQAGAYGCTIELRAGGRPCLLIAAEPDLAHAFALSLVEQRPALATSSVFEELSVDAAADVSLWVAASRARLQPATVQAAVEAVSVLREVAVMRERGVLNESEFSLLKGKLLAAA